MIESLLYKLLRRVKAKKVQTFLEDHKKWFPTLDLYDAVIQLEDQLHEEDLPPGYDFWAKEAGDASRLGKALFILEARKVIRERLGQPSGPLPGEGDRCGVAPPHLACYERNVKTMSDDILDGGLQELQEERYYFRRDCRRGEATDFDRRDNLWMELWGVAARHEGGKRDHREQPKKEAAARICHAMYGFYLRSLRKDAMRFMGSRFSDNQLAAEEIHSTQVIQAGQSPNEVVDAIFLMATRKIMKQRELPRATSTEGLVHLRIETPQGVLRGPMWEEDAMWYVLYTSSAVATLTLDLRKGYRELRGTTSMSYSEAKNYFFFYFWNEAHEWYYEEMKKTVQLEIPVTVWRDLKGTMWGNRPKGWTLNLAVATRDKGLGLTLDLTQGLMRCAAELPLAKAQQLFFPRQELHDEGRPSYWVEEQ
jgi:hypothetical protein